MSILLSGVEKIDIFCTKIICKKKYKRLAIFSHFDKNNIVDKYVIYMLEQLHKLKFDIEDLLYDLEDNKLIQEQIYFQHIQEQINRLEEDFLKISTISDDINSKISSSIYEESRIIGNEIPYNISVNERSLNKIMYSTTIFNQIIKSIDRVDTKENKIFFQEKLKLLFKIVYKKNYSEIVISFNKALEHNCKQKKYIDEIVQEMSKLNNYFSK